MSHLIDIVKITRRLIGDLDKVSLAHTIIKVTMKFMESIMNEFKNNSISMLLIILIITIISSTISPIKLS
jgi:hypothetical protein